MPAAARPRAASSRRKRSLDADFELEVPCKSSRRAAEAGIRRRQSTCREMEEAADAAAEEEEVALLRSMGQRPSRGSGSELLSLELGGGGRVPPLLRSVGHSVI